MTELHIRDGRDRQTQRILGTNYCGWQVQKNGETIESVLNRAIGELTGEEIHVMGSSRTDAGVHANGQTATVVLSGQVEDGFFKEKINSRLPGDIRILDAELVRNGFHARKSAVGKRYIYQLDLAEKPDVFTRRYTYHFPQQLDLDAMRKEAQLLIGTYEFAGYTDKKDEKSTKRTIYAIMICGQGSKVSIQYEGTGFLYHMVRILTGTLLEVGTGARSIESVKEPLKSKDRSQAGFLAPARGLFLDEVYY